MKTKFLSVLALVFVFSSCSKETAFKNDGELFKKDTEEEYLNINHVLNYGCGNEMFETDPTFPGMGVVSMGFGYTVAIDVDVPNSMKVTSDWVCYYREKGSSGTWYRSEQATSGFYPLVFNLTQAVGRPWNTPGAYMADLDPNVCWEFVLCYWPAMNSGLGSQIVNYTFFNDVPLSLSNIGDYDNATWIRWGELPYEDEGVSMKGYICCEGSDPGQ